MKDFIRLVILSLFYSPALGHGWQLGFLGLLHLEVFSQRLEQEYGADSIITAPSVTYKIKLKETNETRKSGKSLITINNPAHFPSHQTIEECFEPIVSGKKLLKFLITN